MRTTAYICIEINDKIHYTYVSNITNLYNFIINLKTFGYNKVHKIISQYPKIQNIGTQITALNVGHIGGIDVRVVNSISELKIADYVFLFNKVGMQYYINNNGYERYTFMEEKQFMNQYFWVNFSQESIKKAKNKELKSENGFMSVHQAKEDAHVKCEGYKIILVNSFTNEYEVVDLCGVV